MPFAYVTEPGAVVRKEGETLSVTKDGQTLAEWKLIHLEGLVLFGGVQLTTPAMLALLNQHIETSFVTQHGKLLGQLVPPKTGNVQIRVAQYRLACDSEGRLRESQRIVQMKIAAMLGVLVRYSENHPDPSLKSAKHRLRESEGHVMATQSLEELRGVEGAAAAVYWQCFPLMNRSELAFEGRSRQPPLDPVNALLSLGYVFLTNELKSSLESVGLDPYLGVYHELTPNRPSLSLDLMEPFRHHIVDRFVLRAINLGRFRKSDFQISEEEGIRLESHAMKSFIGDYEQAMTSPGTDSTDGTQQPWRELVRRECLHWRSRIRIGMDESTLEEVTEVDGIP